MVCVDRQPGREYANRGSVRDLRERSVVIHLHPQADETALQWQVVAGPSIFPRYTRANVAADQPPSRSPQPSACIASRASIARIRRVGTRQELSPTSSTIPVERPSATAIDCSTDPQPSGVTVSSNMDLVEV